MFPLTLQWLLFESRFEWLLTVPFANEPQLTKKSYFCEMQPNTIDSAMEKWRSWRKHDPEIDQVWMLYNIFTRVIISYYYNYIRAYSICYWLWLIILISITMQWNNCLPSMYFSLCVKMFFSSLAFPRLGNCRCGL